MSGEPQLHERLRGFLPTARAESCQVIATFLDIRAFSTFAARSESFDAALYLRSVYLKVLISVFADAAFFKPTGDGLLLIHELPFEAEAVPPLITSVLKRCISLVQDFGHITDDDVMVNFSVPQQLGVGVARGSVTRLVSGDFVLDYTGRCLNLAARLMDKARPSGVVFADPHAARLMDAEVGPSFSSDLICIRGIADEEPIAVSVTADVIISPSDREPTSTARNIWGTPTKLKVEHVLRLSNFGFYLPRAPRAHETASVHVQIPIFDKVGKREDSTATFTIAGDVEEEPDGCLVRIKMRDVHESLTGVPQTVASKMLWTTMERATEVTFTPFIKPDDEV